MALPQKWDVQVLTDFPRQFINDLTMSGHLGLEMALLIDAVAAAFPQQHCAMGFQMLDKLASPHGLSFNAQYPLHCSPAPSPAKPHFRLQISEWPFRNSHFGKKEPRHNASNPQFEIRNSQCKTRPRSPPLIPAD
jgi:hypothetical protein